MRICKCEKLSDFNLRLQIRYLGHIARTPNINPAKQLLFNEIIINKKPIVHLDSLEQHVLKQLKNHCDRDEFYRRCLEKTEHQIIPEPEHKKKRKKLVRGGRRKLRNKNNNNNKTVRGKTKSVEPAGRPAIAKSANVVIASGLKATDQVQCSEC